MKSTPSILILGVLFSLAGIATPLFAQWEPDVRLTYNDSASMLSYNNAHCIAASGDTVHVVWYDNRTGNYRIFYKQSTDAGTIWGQDTCLSTGADSSTNPSIAVSGSAIHLVWQDRRDGNWEIYYKRSTDGGETWGADERLTTGDSTSQTPSISVSGQSVYAVWSDLINGTNKIYYKPSTDGGTSWGPDTCLTCGFAGDHELPSLSSSGSVLHLAYQSDGGNIVYKRSSDSGQTWSVDTIIAHAYSDENQSWYYWHPSIVNSGPYVHLVCTYHYDMRSGVDIHKIQYIASTDGGSSWKPDYTLDGRHLPWESCDAATISTSGSHVHVVWFSVRGNNYNSEIYFRNSLDGGTTWQTETRLTADSASSINPFIAVQGNAAHVVWADNRDGNYEIYYKRNSTANGVEFGNVVPPSVPSSILKVLPNPYVSFVTVPGHSSDLFSLYDIAGRKAGTYRGDRIGEGLAAGVYFLKPVGREAKPVRVVKIR